MKWNRALLTLAIALGLGAPLRAELPEGGKQPKVAHDQPLADGGKVFVLESVARPGHFLIQEKNICKLSESGEKVKFRLTKGLGSPICVSFESVNRPAYYLRHQYFVLKIHPYAENDNLLTWDSTYILRENEDGSVGFESYRPRTFYIGAKEGSDKLYILKDESTELKNRSFFMREVTD